jgi:pantoate--beta-alanine ligase
MSSRNVYLNSVERAEADYLQMALRQVADAIQAGRSDWHEMEREAAAHLVRRGWRPDYVAIRRQRDLGEPADGVPLVILGAARLGTTRLIDNVELS